MKYLLLAFISLFLTAKLSAQSDPGFSLYESELNAAPYKVAVPAGWDSGITT